jgi:predicted PurR-regulated permease PerM
MGKKAFSLFMALFWVLSLFSGLAEAKDGFTQKDRELLIRLETTLKVFMEQTDKRFEQIDKRFEGLHSEMDKRFEQVDKRFAELRSDMNKRFEQMMTFLWILASVFSALVVAVIGFALWDRKTMIRRARSEIEKEGRLSDLIQALRELARKDKDLADVLRHFNLL